MEIKPIAFAENDYTGKFGVPRQSGLIESVETKIIFNEEFSSPTAFKCIDMYERLWIIWGFSLCENQSAALTVRPPRLGGNKRVGVFASRSPFRPNSLGLSCVKLLKIEKQGKNMALFVTGADFANGTPIFDVKPYLAYVDSYPLASNGFALAKKEGDLRVEAGEEIKKLPPQKRQGLIDILSQDPRPSYREDAREYGFEYAGFNIKFKVENETAYILSVNEAD